MSPVELPPPGDPVSINDLIEQAERAERVIKTARKRILDPSRAKQSPRFSLTQLAQLCGLERGAVQWRLSKGDLPPGVVRDGSNRREFSLAEARQWIAGVRGRLRPEGCGACTITVGNFKGGSTKTTTAMTLAQGLSLRGHRVLAVDLDPQGSLTTLFGLVPVAEVEQSATVTPLMFGDEADLGYAVHETYWDGIDLIPAMPGLFNAEFVLPTRQMREPAFEFWDVLNRGLEPLRQDYDVIVIDTPPALSYLTINAFFASNGLIVPMPPHNLDFVSSGQFWRLFSDMASAIAEKRRLTKTFDFVSVLLAKVEMNAASASIVRSWIADTYGSRVLPIEIPKTAVTDVTAVELGTVYDVTKYAGHAQTYARAREAYDRMVELVETDVLRSWSGQLQRAGHAPAEAA